MLHRKRDVARPAGLLRHLTLIESTARLPGGFLPGQVSAVELMQRARSDCDLALPCGKVLSSCIAGGTVQQDSASMDPAARALERT